MIIDCHVHCGVDDASVPQAYEDILPLFLEADLDAVVCFSPVMEIYDRNDPHFVDTPAWKEQRQRSRQYLTTLADKPVPVLPFYFVWNDFDTSTLSDYCGIKWHRHAREPDYHYGCPACTAMLDAIRDMGFAVLIEEEYRNTLRFVDELAPGVPVIIPHLGRLNGGFEQLLADDFWARPHTYADMSAAAVTVDECRRFLDRYGPERLLFGSDYPFGRSPDSKATILELNLPAADEELVFSGNIRRLLKNTERYLNGV